jgi:hypothetical protein
MADDCFTRTKFVWLDQVIADPTVCANAFRLAYLLAARFLNRKTRVAYPGQEKLAALLGLSTPKAVKYLSDQLVAGGHLTVEASHGRGQTNKYTLVVLKTGAEPVVDGPADGDDDAAPTLFAEIEKTETDVSNIKKVSNNQPAEPVSDLGGFPAWWSHYPKKVSKPAARKAYDRIVNAGVASPAELLAGVLRYAASRTDQDHRYTKNPDGWLNGNRWTDEIETTPQGGAPADGHRNGASWTEIALDGLRK